MKPKNFFIELKRRNIYKVAVAYAVVGWLLVQIATQTFPLSTLNAICGALSCQPGDILRFEPEHAEREPASNEETA